MWGVLQSGVSTNSRQTNTFKGVSWFAGRIPYRAEWKARSSVTRWICRDACLGVKWTARRHWLDRRPKSAGRCKVLESRAERVETDVGCGYYGGVADSGTLACVD